jgi:hypothetical protein
MFKDSLEIDAKILAKYSRYIISQDPVVGDISMIKKIHSGGVIYKSAEKELAVPLGVMSAEMAITMDDVYGFNMEKICLDIYEYAQTFLQDITKTMFSTISQVSDFTGNVIDGKGKGVTHELLIEMLEKIHIDFDRDGNPIMPSIVIHPDMAKTFEKLKADEGLYKSRIDKIINRKREAYYAEKGRRGLSRID